MFGEHQNRGLEHGGKNMLGLLLFPLEEQPPTICHANDTCHCQSANRETRAVVVVVQKKKRKRGTQECWTEKEEK